MSIIKLKDWKLSSLNGILAIIFGLVALFFPQITIVSLAIYFAVTILLGGLALIISSVIKKESLSRWYILLLEGVVGIILGVLILAQPQSAATFFVALMGFWALFIGLVFLFTYFRKDLPEIMNIFHIVAGIISILIGFLIVLNPFESTRVITVLIAIYAIAYGVISLINTSKIGN
ncbi:MAG: HdeD family acid-resistance protein [Bacteroidales bacterium]